MLNNFLILLGKTVLRISQTLGLGSGSTWPGHIVMETNPKFVRQILKKNPNLKVVIVAGTNGKTTTSLMLQRILEEGGLKVFRNEAGANLLNGVASNIIENTNLTGRLNFDVAIFEVDENNVRLVIQETNPFAILFLNIFRDQLDRYGEVNQVLKDWQEALARPRLAGLQGLALFTNGDDPALSFLAKKSILETFLFGVDEKLMMKDSTGHDVDFIYCPNCQTKLEYQKISYSHMGKFKCLKCGFTNPKTETFSTLPPPGQWPSGPEATPLFGIYNVYNANAAALVANKAFCILEDKIRKALGNFKPAFGRQEIIKYRGRNVLILLSKNPAGFNQSISAVNDIVARSHAAKQPPNVLLVLNDRIPDGRDVSWIWDVDFENLPKNSKIFISGERSYDLALRIKYSNQKAQVYGSLNDAIENATNETQKDETLFILPTYSAMLETRKILLGRKLL